MKKSKELLPSLLKKIALFILFCLFTFLVKYNTSVLEGFTWQGFFVTIWVFILLFSLYDVLYSIFLHLKLVRIEKRIESMPSFTTWEDFTDNLEIKK